jgi:hypothetical protein
LNAGPFQKRKRDLSTEDFEFQQAALLDAHHDCHNPVLPQWHGSHSRRFAQMRSPMVKRSTAASPGYTTTDDFGSDGDDTVHTAIPFYTQPNDFQANASFPTDSSLPDKVDVIFLDFIESYIIDALASAGANYTSDDVSYYLPKAFTTNSYLPVYAKDKWQAGIPNCPVGAGIGS